MGACYRRHLVKEPDRWPNEKGQGSSDTWPWRSKPASDLVSQAQRVDGQLGGRAIRPTGFMRASIVGITAQDCHRTLNSLVRLEVCSRLTPSLAYFIRRFSQVMVRCEPQLFSRILLQPRVPKA
jgi:hypothetical protein